MSAPVPSISLELRALMRRLRLGKLLDTLPERVALARAHDLTHLGVHFERADRLQSA